MEGWGEGFLSRLLYRPRGRSGPGSAEVQDGGVGWADNAGRPVRPLVERVLQEPAVLIVTGYQDFLSALSILWEAVPDLHERPVGSVRLVFGTNTQKRMQMPGKGRPVGPEARAYFLGARGLSVADMADLRAVLALGAIRSGIIQLRAFDPALAQERFGKRPVMLHSKLVVGTRTALSGSANFSHGGLCHNIEFVDDAGGHAQTVEARRWEAEQSWEMGADWTESALEVLESLVRLASPEEAVARTVDRLLGFGPWRVQGSATTGRAPQPFQADLVYEAAGTVYEYGFAFVEAPTGAGKTDIGRHLASVLPVFHTKSVSSWGEPADRQCLGAVALIPASVEGNWQHNASANFTTVRHSYLSRASAKTQAQEQSAELVELRRKLQSSAAMVVDESHRLSSRFLAPSRRSLVFERAPSIWTACLSATLMGNQGLDGLLAFHEKRASIFASPVTTDAINAHLVKVRERGVLLKEIALAHKRAEGGAIQGDLFETPAFLAVEAAGLEAQMDARGLRARALQEGLSEILAPYVVRRHRACVGESAQRGQGFSYPPMHSHRCPSALTEEQAVYLARIKTLAQSITAGTTLVSSRLKRAAQAEVQFHDKSRIHIRNFLALLRSSVLCARQEWAKEGSEERRGRSLSASLRRFEAQTRQRLMVPLGSLPEEEPSIGEASETPLCDRIGRLLNSPVLDGVDEARGAVMRDIVHRHGHAVFLSDRVGVLDVYAQMVAGPGKKGIEAFVLAGDSSIKGRKGVLHHIKYGAQAQEVFGRNGGLVDMRKNRAIFLTFQMAEGINLQMASALGVIGVVSDIKSFVQGLGRIDRIDSPHEAIHYYTFDTPGLVLASDHKAVRRLEEAAFLSGVGGQELEDELVEFSAGDLTDKVLGQIRQDRPLRKNNFYDQAELLRRSLPAGVLDRVRAARPQGVWGAEVCMLAAQEPVMIVVLAGHEGSLSEPVVQPPRLLAVRERDGICEVLGDQPTVARLLVGAWEETRRRGLADVSPTVADMSRILGRMEEALPQMTHWDTRPAGTVSLLASLARFLSGEDRGDGGRTFFDGITAPGLQKLAQVWARELDGSWIAAKEAISTASADGDMPDYLGIPAIEAQFFLQPEDRILGARLRMEDVLSRCQEESRNLPLDIFGRVCVVFEGRPDR